ncbi:MAG TPA: P63C domain-containing protein [Bacteroidia bacterium]|nr:P63C domain-containing protein [Bacteroidia bacterium]
MTASIIVDLFGGQSALASVIGKRQSTIQHWVKTGSIPKKYHDVIIKAAKERNIDINETHFSVMPIPSSDNEIGIPKATHFGELTIGAATIPCYVLDTGERVMALKGVVVALMAIEGGQLAEYLKVKSLQPFLPTDLTPQENNTVPALIKFDTGTEGFTKHAIGVPVEKFMDICAAYSTALQESSNPNSGISLTARQIEIALRANAFLRASAKTGIIALVDEATGYQYQRPLDALQFKMKLFLEDEMRKWEKTFPDELWKEFGRLTKWNGTVHSRPKYWGKLVMELVYDYLDPDVAQWLKTNAPKPSTGVNYHQWLSGQYGLKKLIEHIWMVVGMASACTTMSELRRKMAEKYGRVPIQYTFYLPPTP